MGRITRTSLAWQRHSTSSWMSNTTKWTWRVSTSTRKSLRWQLPRPPSTPTPAHVSGKNGATGDNAVPLVEVECLPELGLLRRKPPMVAISVKEAARMRNTATKNPAPSTANGASGLPGQSAMLSMVMETGTAIGCTLSQPCLEAVNAKEIATKPKLATTCSSADRRNRNKPQRLQGWRTFWKTESNSCNQLNNQYQS